MVNVLRVGDGVGARDRSERHHPCSATVVYANLLVKRGGAPEECEDRVAWRRDDGGDFRAAVADGASASLLAGEWAELLATTYCTAGDAFDTTVVTRAAESWRGMIQTQPLPWYAQAKAALGAFAALVGVTISANGAFTVLTAGDSCAFLVRQGRLVAGYPTDRADDFGRSPVLLGTMNVADGLFWRHTGTFEPGDDLYLMTDALAAWALAELGADRDPWTWLQALGSVENPLSFERWIDEMRDAGRLENDDVSLLHLRLGAGGSR